LAFQREKSRNHSLGIDEYFSVIGIAVTIKTFAQFVGKFRN